MNSAVQAAWAHAESHRLVKTAAKALGGADVLPSKMDYNHTGWCAGLVLPMSSSPRHQIIERLSGASRVKCDELS